MIATEKPTPTHVAETRAVPVVDQIKALRRKHPGVSVLWACRQAGIRSRALYLGYESDDERARVLQVLDEVRAGKLKPVA